MAKANLVMPGGTTVQIEGTAEEVATLLAKCSSGGSSQQLSSKDKKKKGKRCMTSGAGVQRKSKVKGPRGLITDLVTEDFFKTKRSLPEIQKKLEEGGHIYAQTSLSPAVLALTKKKILRRLDEKKGWAYARGSVDIG